MGSMSMQSADPSRHKSAPARLSDCLIFTPTYNERGNIGPMLDALLAIEPRCDVLIVDDRSTDGTTALLLERAAVEPRLNVVVRPGKLGIGSAHKLAWLYARRNHYARIVTLDADFSHNPADIPRLLATLDGGADVAFGSRYMPGGGLDYRGWRLFLSRNANLLARRLLRLSITEYTTSLRAVRLSRVPGRSGRDHRQRRLRVLPVMRRRLRARRLENRRDPDPLPRSRPRRLKIPRLEIFRGATNLMRLALQVRRPFPGLTLQSPTTPAPAAVSPIARCWQRRRAVPRLP